MDDLPPNLPSPLQRWVDAVKAGDVDALTTHLDEIHGRADAWYLLGHTEGSRVPSALEAIQASVIWRAVGDGEQLAGWSIFKASDDNRRRFGLARNPDTSTR